MLRSEPTPTPPNKCHIELGRHHLANIAHQADAAYKRHTPVRAVATKRMSHTDPIHNLWRPADHKDHDDKQRYPILGPPIE